MKATLNDIKIALQNSTKCHECSETYFHSRGRELISVKPIMHNNDVVFLQFEGWSINLYDDGTYKLENPNGVLHSSVNNKLKYFRISVEFETYYEYYTGYFKNKDNCERFIRKFLNFKEEDILNVTIESLPMKEALYYSSGKDK